MHLVCNLVSKYMPTIYDSQFLILDSLVVAGQSTPLVNEYGQVVEGQTLGQRNWRSQRLGDVYALAPLLPARAGNHWRNIFVSYCQ
jgi:hypothetical protein